MIILGTNSIKDTGYDVANSLRFNSGSSDYLTRTPSGTGNRRTWTFSAWVKRTNPGAGNQIFQQSQDGSNYMKLYFSSDKIFWRGVSGGSNSAYIVTNRLFRDVSAWYHIVARFDSTNGTAGDRMRLYVNGVEETSFSTDINPSSNYDSFANTTNPIDIGRDNVNNASYFNGYMTEVCMVDGQSLAPDQFGEFDEDSGIWKPIDVSGLTFGTNGFYLDFEDSSALGNDVSGNNNDFTVNNLTAIDSVSDVPTNNFATLNPLGNYFPASTFSEGNLKVTFNSSNYSFNNSTIGVSSGKWYFETKIITAATDNQQLIGISDRDSIGTTDELGSGAYQYGFYGGNSGGDSGTGKVRNNNSYSSYSDGTTYTAGDIIGTYVDLDNNKIYFAKNGTILNSGTGFTITAPASTDSGFYFLSVGSYSGSNSPVYEVNFGNPIFTGTDKSDANGYGLFEYDPSVGTFDSASKDFYALNTKNLAEYG